MKYLLTFTILCLNTLLGHTQYLHENIYNQSRINKIPKIIHQIWVGPKKMPEVYKVYANSIKRLHPDWEYKLWTNKDIENFPWTNKKLFDRVSNPGMKSDIWRYEILYEYGGLYLDMDVECIRPFDPMHERLEFYAGYCGNKFVNISVIGSAPGSDFLGSIINDLSRKTKKLCKQRVVVSTVMNETGPYFFTKHVNNARNFFSNPRNIILPDEYFQPIFHGHGGTAQTEKEMYDLKHTCFVNHRNGLSWMH